MFPHVPMFPCSHVPHVPPCSPCSLPCSQSSLTCPRCSLPCFLCSFPCSRRSPSCSLGTLWWASWLSWLGCRVGLTWWARVYVPRVHSIILCLYVGGGVSSFHHSLGCPTNLFGLCPRDQAVGLLWTCWISCFFP